MTAQTALFNTLRSNLCLSYPSLRPDGDGISCSICGKSYKRKLLDAAKHAAKHRRDGK